MQAFTIAVDAMGGDLGPAVTVPAIARALLLYPSLSVRLFVCGDISSDIKSAGLENHPRLTLVSAACTVGMDERPSSALRTKRDSTMGEAIKDVADGQSQACVSAGNTGALMALSRHFLKTLPGIDRPAIVSAMPAVNGKRVYMLDLGANVACDSETLYQFAVMGSAMARTVEGIGSPRVALLNIGEEEVKGNDQVRHAANLLQDAPSINYIGYLEGHDIFTNKADVIVCDGFVGNVTLKTCEGIAQFFLAQLKESFGQSLWGRVLGWLIRPFVRTVYARVNPDQYNGASLVGLRGIVVKSHGNAGIDAFFNAIEQALHSAERQLPDGIESSIGTVLLDKH
ncbi:MAG: phosphate acyltransferase PlsX [Pseudomonadota bacterium]|uniref:phosphate acyltransferase PlsX n=1 Tax=Gallaecimonas pentaromativorans TaxID=584787 RepID=UPI0009F82605|nr:phosphate acyltransferase PlsX [Gallaecimonas pentaromativorans]MED5525377.1 phosphate acyltransferase PlsX [Pseudomonadota bacterium]